MRIIAGKFKGSSLHIPKTKKIRPLKDMARESIFNLLTHSKKLNFQFEMSAVLDLYSGTGSFGLECLSRMAKKVLFVEKEDDALKMLKKNIRKLELKEKTIVFNDDVIRFLKKQDSPLYKFDLIFCDPPFKETNTEELIELIFNKKLLKKEGTLILHRNKNSTNRLPKYLKLIEERFYGISKITFIKNLF